jgi:peptidoglycan hydrolase-like protein with peptidoglycan-binding domain
VKPFDWAALHAKAAALEAAGAWRYTPDPVDDPPTRSEVRKAQREDRLNRLANAIAAEVGENGFLPLTVRYRAAAYALTVVEDWERKEIL